MSIFDDGNPKSFKVGEEVLFINPIATENGDHRQRVGYIIKIEFVKVRGKKKKEVIFFIGTEPDSTTGVPCHESEIESLPARMKHQCEFKNRSLPQDLRNFSSFTTQKYWGH